MYCWILIGCISVFILSFLFQNLRHWYWRRLLAEQQLKISRLSDDKLTTVTAANSAKKYAEIARDAERRTRIIADKFQQQQQQETKKNAGRGSGRRRGGRKRTPTTKNIDDDSKKSTNVTSCDRRDPSEIRFMVQD